MPCVSGKREKCERKMCRVCGQEDKVRGGKGRGLREGGG